MRWRWTATTFAARVTEAISSEPLITITREEVTRIDEDQITIIATGPLTSDALSQEIARLSGSSHLYFFDSISPIVEADSIDMSKVYLAARYDKGSADYINCPMSKEEYDRFCDALISGESAEQRDWEKLNYFEGCLPIEEIARRGRDTLRFGPMKPVGLKDPRTGRIPYAAVQLRQENLRADSYNLVGFQNHLKFGDQARVLRLIPGLENARFLRYGQIHRNTYINAPTLLSRIAADERTSVSVLCRTNLRRRRICRVDCHRIDGGNSRRGAGSGIGAGRPPRAQRLRLAGALRHPRRCQEFPAGEYHLRPAAAAGPQDSRPPGAAPAAVRAGAAGI